MIETLNARFRRSLTQIRSLGAAEVKRLPTISGRMSKSIVARSPRIQVAAGAPRPATVPGLTSQVLPPLMLACCPISGFVAVAAADQVVVAGAGHAVAVVRVVGEEDAPAAELRSRHPAVVVELAVGVAGQLRDGDRVAEVVAVHDMHRQAELERGLQGVGADDVAAMDDGLGALRPWLPRRRRPACGPRSWLSETMQIFMCRRSQMIDRGRRDKLARLAVGRW